MGKGITPGLNHLRRAHLAIQIRTRRKIKVVPLKSMLQCGCFLLRTAFLAAAAYFFFLPVLLVLAFFGADFLWFDFGDLAAITFICFCRLTHLRHLIFSEGTHNVTPQTLCLKHVNKCVSVISRCLWGEHPIDRGLMTRYRPQPAD
jgi:hypothetical protein